MIALYPCVKFVGIEDQVIQDGVMFAQNHSHFAYGIHTFNMDEDSLAKIIDSAYATQIVAYLKPLVENPNHLTKKEKWKIIEFLIFADEIWIDGYGEFRTKGLDIVYIYGEVVGTQLHRLDIDKIKNLPYLAINYYTLNDEHKQLVYNNHKIYWSRFAYTKHTPSEKVIKNNLEWTLKVIDSNVQKIKNRTSLVNEFPIMEVLDYSNL